MTCNSNSQIDYFCFGLITLQCIATTKNGRRLLLFSNFKITFQLTKYHKVFNILNECKFYNFDLKLFDIVQSTSWMKTLYY